LPHRGRLGVRNPHGHRRHRPGAVLPAVPQQAEGGLMALTVDDAVPGPVTRDDPPRARRRAGGKVRSAVEIALLAVFLGGSLFAVMWILQTSVKTGEDIYAVPAKFFGFDVTLQHYKDVFVAPGGGRSELSGSFLNSVVVAGSSTALATLLGVPAAWAYSR